MKETITESQFIDRFKAIRPDNFSYSGLRALFEYLEQYEEYSGQELELDVIALCCDFTEYTNFAEFSNDYDDIDEDDIENHTTVIPVGDEAFIIQQF